MATRNWRKSYNVIVLLLLGLSVSLHIWLANLRHPIPPSSGTHINPPTQWRTPKSPTFRVSTYNIHRGKGTDQIRDLSRSAALLQNMDITGLNELDGPFPFNSTNQAEIIARQIDTGWLFAPNQRRWYQDYFGNGLLSRFPVNSWIALPLIYNQASSHSLRNMIRAHIRINETPVTFIVTHLDRGKIRLQQLQFILDEFKRYQPAILLGDLNTRPQNSLLKSLFSQSNSIDAIAMALPEIDHKHRIDWIITRGLTVMAGGKTDEGVSDHPNYWVDLKIDEVSVDGNDSPRSKTTPSASTAR